MLLVGSPDDVAFKLLLHGFQIPEHVLCAGRRGDGCLRGVGVLDYSTSKLYFPIGASGTVNSF